MLGKKGVQTGRVQRNENLLRSKLHYIEQVTEFQFSEIQYFHGCCTAIGIGMRNSC